MASELGAEHIKVSESKPRTIGMIALDMTLNRTPKIIPKMKDLDTDGLVIFMGPVWMGHVAAPLRACFKELKGHLNQYAYVSISGGADGPNLKLDKELNKRLGKAPVKVIDLHIADLLPSEPKPTRKDTMKYHLTEKDVGNLTTIAVKALREIMIK
jgi:hypothetical protein